MRADRAFVSLLQFAFCFSEKAFRAGQAEMEIINSFPEKENHLSVVTKRKTPLTCMVFLPYLTADGDVFGLLL